MGELPVEFWKWDGSGFDMTKSRFQTENWRSYTESFLVEEGDFAKLSWNFFL